MMGDASFVAFNSINPIYMDMDECNFPVYGVKFVPEDEKLEASFMKMDAGADESESTISFTRKVESVSNGIEILLFNSADDAAQAIINLSLIGKSRRRTKGDYDVVEFGNFNPNAKYTIKKRIKQEWADKGMVMAMLMNRFHSSSFDDCLKHFQNINWQQGIASGSTELTYEKLIKSRDSLGAVLSYEIGKFTIMSIYKILFLKRAPWFFRFANRSDFKCNNSWEWAFLNDRYDLNKLEVNEKKIIPGPIECVLGSKEIAGELKSHTEFGMTFSNESDPFLEYEITRVD